MIKRSWFQMLTLMKGNPVFRSVSIRFFQVSGKSDILKKRFRLYLAEYEISKLPEDSKKYLSEIWLTGI